MQLVCVVAMDVECTRRLLWTLTGPIEVLGG